MLSFHIGLGLSRRIVQASPLNSVSGYVQVHSDKIDLQILEKKE
jgi:hypothetical protein